jgi:hypothetical protein
MMRQINSECTMYSILFAIGLLLNISGDSHYLQSHVFLRRSGHSDVMLDDTRSNGRSEVGLKMLGIKLMIASNLPSKFPFGPLFSKLMILRGGLDHYGNKDGDDWTQGNSGRRSTLSNSRRTVLEGRHADDEDNVVNNKMASRGTSRIGHSRVKRQHATDETADWAQEEDNNMVEDNLDLDIGQVRCIRGP